MSLEHWIETSALGIVVPGPAAIAAPFRSFAPSPVTVTGALAVSVPCVPVPHVMVLVGSSPQPASAAMAIRQSVPLMCAQRTHRPPKLHRKMIGRDVRQKLAPQTGDP